MGRLKELCLRDEFISKEHYCDDEIPFSFCVGSRMWFLLRAAKADPLDFNARIQDPPTSFPTYDITTSTFDVIFGASCPSDASDATGCFSPETTKRGATITSIELIFPDTIGLDGQPVGCTTSEPLYLVRHRYLFVEP